MKNGSDNKTLRFVIFILVFMIVVMFFVFIFVIPSIKTYKSKKAEYFFQKRQEAQLREKRQTLEQELKSLQKKYKDSLGSFANDFNKSGFLTLAKRYFSNVSLKEIKKTKSESGLDIYEFHADFNADTPIKFYEFVDALKGIDNVIKINFPVVLQAVNDKIDLKFNMSVYHVKEK